MPAINGFHIVIAVTILLVCLAAILLLTALYKAAKWVVASFIALLRNDSAFLLVNVAAIRVRFVTFSQCSS
jgi:hypothetical protein